ncbi:MAG TPA: glutathione S-transferase family protein [Rhodopila sp.]|uniref:glutathione S-transferase family protein n=1 Tax=Rhodopila sp. TaxID=2480087 RepID=UPI002B894177|nr:glutathione S-transferase family protein [Rhodopila sp.]HVY15305.1 glutathione S-transferase family protein [Rhodopila sp.]
MYTFYQSPGSSSMAVHIGLHEVGAPFQTKRIVFAERDKDPPEFRSLNPEGKVPTLVVDGRPITEVAACLYYLAHTYPDAKLFPFGDVEASAQVISWMSFVASTVHPARRQGEDHARMIYGIADRRLGHQTWAVGRYSIADIHLFRLFWRFGRGLAEGTAGFPNLMRHYEQMMQRPAVKKTLEIEAAEGYALP